MEKVKEGEELVAITHKLFVVADKYKIDFDELKEIIYWASLLQSRADPAYQEALVRANGRDNNARPMSM